MTEEEIRKIAKVLETADGGCPHCAAKLATEFNESFPNENYKIIQIEEKYEKYTNYSLVVVPREDTNATS
jgi:hypothetical protein